MISDEARQVNGAFPSLETAFVYAGAQISGGKAGDQIASSIFIQGGFGHQLGTNVEQ
jgi:hypothetical protein